MQAWRLERAGSMDPNPTTFTSRSGQFARTAGALGGGTLLMLRTGDQLTGYALLPKTTESETAVAHLASAVAASAVPMEQMPDLTQASTIATAVIDPDGAASRESLQGTDMAEAARAMSVAMSAGDWAAVTMRAPSSRERNRHRRWLADRLGTQSPTHHSIGTEATVITIRVGSSSARSARFLLGQVCAALPGFDVKTRAVVPSSRTARVLATVGTGLVLWGAARWGLAAIQTDWMPQLPWARIGDLGGVVLTALATLWAFGVLRAPGDGARAALASGRLRGAHRPWWKVRWRGPRTITPKDSPAKHVPGSYPLARTGFLVGPQIVTGLVAPHAGATSGESSTAARATPSTLTRRIGPLVGVGADGAKVYLSAEDMLYGVGLLGRPGSGKSQLVRSLFAWSLLERRHPAHVEGFPGAAHGLIAFESKADGAVMYEQWGTMLGQRPVLVEVADPDTPAIDLFQVPGTVKDKATFFVNAMRYAFGEEAIGNRAYPALIQLFTGALAVTPTIASQVPGVRHDASPVYYAFVLVGGEGESAATGLAAEIIAEAVRTENGSDPESPLQLARRELVPLFQDMTPAARRSMLESATNKVRQIAAAEMWWSPARTKRSWSQVLTDHSVVVINTGTTRSGLQVDDTLTDCVGSMLMYGLQSAIKRTCAGWQEQGKFTSIFADELALLAGSSPEVLVWLRNQGRSYGARPVFATQYPDQLDPQVRMALMSFSTLMTFAQDNATVAEQVATDAAVDGSAWTAADVVNLPRFNAILRTNVAQRRVSACTFSAPHFEADMSTFSLEQGYGELATLSRGAIW